MSDILKHDEIVTLLGALVAMREDKLRKGDVEDTVFLSYLMRALNEHPSMQAEKKVSLILPR